MLAVRFPLPLTWSGLWVSLTPPHRFLKNQFIHAVSWRHNPKPEIPVVEDGLK